MLELDYLPLLSNISPVALNSWPDMRDWLYPALNLPFRRSALQIRNSLRRCFFFVFIWTRQQQRACRFQRADEFPGCPLLKRRYAMASYFVPDPVSIAECIVMLSPAGHRGFTFRDLGKTLQMLTEVLGSTTLGSDGQTLWNALWHAVGVAYLRLYLDRLFGRQPLAESRRG